MVKLEIRLFDRINNDKQTFYAELANGDMVAEDLIVGEGRTPYQALADLVDEMKVHEYFRADNE